MFDYDPNGNLATLTPPGRPEHGFQYTPVGLVRQYDPPGIPGPKPTKYFYSLDRQLDSLVRPDSIVVRLGYDTAGRPQAVTFDRGTLTLGYSPTTGNLTGIRTPTGDSLTFSYDGSLPIQTRWVGTVNGTVAVSYDNDFRVASQTVNGGNAVSFGYDGDGFLTSAGGLRLGRSATNGLLLADTLGPVRGSYQYTSRGELQSYRIVRSGATLFAAGYTRDSLGRIVQLFDTTQGTPTRWSFVYDSVGRVAADSVNGAVFHVFTYDANGNRLSFTSSSGTVNYSYDAQDRLLSAGTTTYTYGSNGELKTKVVPGVGTTTYTYDALGNLVTVLLPSGTRIDYVIDGQNRRIGRKVNGVLVQGWLYQNQPNPIAELDAAGNVTSRFVYGTRVNVPDYLIKNGVTYRMVADHLGSVRLVVDTSTGAIAQRLDYDEWGNVTQNTAPGFQPFGFAGGLTDQQTGLVRFGARDYDPSVGRWTAKDPIDFGGHDANLYVYVGNDPLSFVDPEGQQIELGWIWTWPLQGPDAYHTFLRVTPENQAPYLLIAQAGPEGRLMFTLSAGPSRYPLPFGDLVSRLNRSPENRRYDAATVLICPPAGLTEDEFIRRLLNLEAAYADNARYRGDPDYRRAGYNSNSYISGLLAAAGVTGVRPGAYAPGWDIPLPASYFGR